MLKFIYLKIKGGSESIKVVNLKVCIWSVENICTCKVGDMYVMQCTHCHFKGLNDHCGFLFLFLLYQVKINVTCAHNNQLQRLNNSSDVIF